MGFLLDTNFLLIPGNYKVDVFRELQMFGKQEFYTSDLVLKELENLSSGKGQPAIAARLALQLITMKGVKILASKGKNTDKSIEDLALERNYTVCTQDKELIKRLKGKKMKVISLRQKRYLVEI